MNIDEADIVLSTTPKIMSTSTRAAATNPNVRAIFTLPGIDGGGAVGEAEALGEAL